MTANAIVRRAAEVYNAVVARPKVLRLTTSAADLAYLLGAIITQSGCEWPRNRPIVFVLQSAFAADHAVWSYITFE